MFISFNITGHNYGLFIKMDDMNCSEATTSWLPPSGGL